MCVWWDVNVHVTHLEAFSNAVLGNYTKTYFIHLMMKNKHLAPEYLN